MKLRKRTGVLAAATAMAALGLAAPAASASDVGVLAHPTGCSYGKWQGDSSYAECTRSNGGSYRAIVVCTPLDGGPLVTRMPRAWVTSGQSVVFCPPMTVYNYSGIETRASS